MTETNNEEKSCTFSNLLFDLGQLGDDLRAMEVHTDMMYPELLPGDRILVNRNYLPEDFKRKIFVFYDHQDKNYLVLYAMFNGSENLILSTNNPTVLPKWLEEKQNSAYLSIIGEVVLMQRNFKIEEQEEKNDEQETA